MPKGTVTIQREKHKLMDAEKIKMPEEQRPSASYANKLLLVIVLLLAVVIAALLPSYLKNRIGKYAEKNVAFALTELYATGRDPSTDYVFRADVRNAGSVPFDQAEGDLEIYVHSRLVCECHCTMSGTVEPGKTSHYDFGIKDISDPESLQRIGPMDYKYIWTLTYVRWVTEDGMKHGVFYNQDKR